MNERRESVYSGSVGGTSASGASVGAGVARRDDAYGTYSRAPHYRAAHAAHAAHPTSPHALPDHY